MKYAVTAATGNLGQAAVKELNKLAGAENVIVIIIPVVAEVVQW